ncbi:MAG: ribonuclease T2 family protein [Geminicoccaceae bacterium]
MTRTWLLAASLALSAAIVAPAGAFEPMDGCFVATAVCPAARSISTASNPGGIATEVDRAYELLGANRADQPSHFQIRITAAVPRDRWVEIGCGHVVAACDLPGEPSRPAEGSTSSGYVLAASWQPAFCQTHRTKTECQTQTEARFDSAHFALHGLWPQPRDKVYCGVSREQRTADEAGRWSDLPPLELTDQTRADLDVVMPGTQSDLQRHEWVKHGTCYSDTAEEYYVESLQLMNQLNASPVRVLLAGRIGERVTADELRAAFDDAFGAGAGDRVEMACSGGLVTELLIHLDGAITETTRFAALIAAADPVRAGCSGGRIDPVGF